MARLMAEGRVKISRRRLRIFDRAVWRKSSRYTLSGLVTMGIGVFVIGLGLLLNLATYSITALLLGFGAIIVVIGIIRLLIGFINPSTPQDLHPGEESERQEEEFQPPAYDEEPADSV
jgi:hypothetical protein